MVFQGLQSESYFNYSYHGDGLTGVPNRHIQNKTHTHSAGEVQCDGANSQHFCLLRRQISCVPSTSCSRSFVSQLTLIYMYSMVNGKRREGMLPFHINSGVPVVVLWSIFKYFPWHTLPDTYICTERWTDKRRERESESNTVAFVMNIFHKTTKGQLNSRMERQTDTQKSVSQIWPHHSAQDCATSFRDAVKVLVASS